jgi:hypothetical protein
MSFLQNLQGKLFYGIELEKASTCANIFGDQDIFNNGPKIGEASSSIFGGQDFFGARNVVSAFAYGITVDDFADMATNDFADTAMGSFADVAKGGFADVAMGTMADVAGGELIETFFDLL